MPAGRKSNLTKKEESLIMLSSLVSAIYAVFFSKLIESDMLILYKFGLSVLFGIIMVFFVKIVKRFYFT